MVYKPLLKLKSAKLASLVTNVAAGCRTTNITVVIDLGFGGVIICGHSFTLSTACASAIYKMKNWLKYHTLRPKPLLVMNVRHRLMKICRDTLTVIMDEALTFSPPMIQGFKANKSVDGKKTTT